MSLLVFVCFLWTVFRSSLRRFCETIFSEGVTKHSQVHTLVWLVGKVESDKSERVYLVIILTSLVCVLSLVFVCVCS